MFIRTGSNGWTVDVFTLITRYLEPIGTPPRGGVPHFALGREYRKEEITIWKMFTCVKRERQIDVLIWTWKTMTLFRQTGEGNLYAKVQCYKYLYNIYYWTNIIIFTRQWTVVVTCIKMIDSPTWVETTINFLPVIRNATEPPRVTATGVVRAFHNNNNNNKKKDCNDYEDVPYYRIQHITY